MLIFRYAALLLAASLAWAQDPVMRGGTRYVEIDVTVRHKRERPPGVREFLKWTFDSGPPFGAPGAPFEGLTKDDFELFDNGKPQPIVVFSRESQSAGSVLPVPPGAFSNRTYFGEESAGSTIVLVDLLNTPFDLIGYAYLGLKEAMSALGSVDSRVGLYTLGTKLHVVHDLSGDPREFREAMRRSEQTGEFPGELARALRDTGGLLTADGGPMVANTEQRLRITMSALHGMLQHISGFPGRKNLIWISQDPLAYTASLALIERANVTLYPVKVRGAGAQLGTGNSMSNFKTFAAYGGRAFYDARDLTFAVQTAQEDLTTHYVLGFYPRESDLDGRPHAITVKVAKQHSDIAEVNYRRQYIATREPPLPVDLNFGTLLQHFDNPLQATGLGLTARVEPDGKAAGSYRVVMTVDLHDVRLRYQDGRFRGSLEFAAPDPASTTSLRTGLIRIDLPEDRYQAALENGYAFATSGVAAVDGEIHIVVRDPESRVWGSLRFPAPDAK